MEFCKAFNAKTQGLPADAPIPVVITAYVDRSFAFITKKSPVSYWLKKAAGIEAGSKTPGREPPKKITLKQVREVAQEKMEDMNAYNEKSAVQMVIGTARSMGLEVEG